MTTLAKKAVSVLSTHKKKAIAVVALAGSFIAMQYTRRTKTFDFALAKLEERVQSQIQKEFKARAELLRKNGNYEEIYSYFSGLDKALKQTLKQDIESLFKVDQLSAACRNKGLSPEEKRKLWVELKQETIIQAVFSLIYVPVSKMVFFIRECIISEQEGIADQENNTDYLLLEAFLTDLSRLVIVEGGKQLCEYLRKELIPIIDQANHLKKYSKEELLGLVDELKNKVLNLEVGEDKTKPNKHASESKIEQGVHRVLTTGKKKRTNLALSEGTAFPEFRVKNLQAYVGSMKHNSVVEDLGKFEAYLKETKERQDQGDNLFENSNIRKDAKLREKDDFPEIEFKDERLALEDGVAVKVGKNEKKEDKETKRMKVFAECGNRFLDLLEARNFNLMGLYTLAYQFEKLKNRVVLYLKSKNTEEMVLALFLPCLQKIVQEEFINEEADEVSENFYHQKIKTVFGFLKDKEVSEEELEICQRVLREAEMKKEVDSAFKEFGKRIYMGNDYDKVSKTDGDGEGKGLELLLNGLSKASIGGGANYE